MDDETYALLFGAACFVVGVVVGVLAAVVAQFLWAVFWS